MISRASQVFVENGQPVLWLFVSKRGEVVKKKYIDAEAVIERFTKIALSAPSNQTKQRIALVHYNTGAMEILNGQGLFECFQNFPTLDPNIIAIQVRRKPCCKTRCCAELSVLALHLHQGTETHALSQ